MLIPSGQQLFAVRSQVTNNIAKLIGREARVDDDGHIVMYIGGGQVIQSTPNGGVKISDAGTYIGKAVAMKRVPG